jgi:hypothetical protein
MMQTVRFVCSIIKSWEHTVCIRFCGSHLRISRDGQTILVFFTDAVSGRRFVTIGAGPSSVGRLVSDLNRSSEIVPHQSAGISLRILRPECAGGGGRSKRAGNVDGEAYGRPTRTKRCHSGECQGSCRMKRHAAMFTCGTATTRSGLSATVAIGSQFRVVPLQRSGCRARARS